MILSVYFRETFIAQCTFALEEAGWQLKSRILRVPETSRVIEAIVHASDHATSTAHKYGGAVTLDNGVRYSALY